jgi:hypothetical protein
MTEGEICLNSIQFYLIMAHWRANFKESDKYLGAVDLWDDQKKNYKQVVVHVEKFFQDEMVGQMGKERKVFAKLKEFTKPMVVNVTNFKRLQKLFDSVEQDLFVGKPIALGVEKVSSPEGKVDALRFSSRAPQVQAANKKPALPDDSLPRAIASITSKAMSIKSILDKYTVTAEQRKALEDAAKDL